MNGRRIRIPLLAAAMVLGAGWAAPAAAHPHIFIRATATIQFENGKVVGIVHEWTFDDFFSNALIGDFDKNKNKAFEGDEIKDLQENAFANLKEFGYFTHVRAGGKPVGELSVKDFTPTITKEGRVSYRFLVLLPEPRDPRIAELDASVHDHTFYVDVELPAANVKLAGTGAATCRQAMVEDRNSPLYFGIAFVRRIEVRCDKA
jgi:ABC-type uncharacterized transport system substrate-binding protein